MDSRLLVRFIWIGHTVSMMGIACSFAYRATGRSAMLAALAFAVLPYLTLEVVTRLKKSMLSSVLLPFFMSSAGFGAGMAFLVRAFQRPNEAAFHLAAKWLVIGAIGFAVGTLFLTKLESDSVEEERDAQSNQTREEIQERLLRPIGDKGGRTITPDWDDEVGDWKLKDTSVYYREVFHQIQSGRTIDDIAQQHGVPREHIAQLVGDIYDEFLGYRVKHERVLEKLSGFRDEFSQLTKGSIKYRIAGFILIGLGLALSIYLLIAYRQ